MNEFYGGHEDMDEALRAVEPEDFGEAGALEDLGETEEPKDTDETLRAEETGDGMTDAQKAADYARSLGFGRAADYIERHYDGGDFVPGEPIPVTTRNMDLDGGVSANGVPFARRTAELTDGLAVEGVFPEFESRHHVELGREAADLPLYRQFSACREDFQDHMFDCPEKLSGLTLADMERMERPQGFTPEGFTWQHNPETGSFDLVSKDDHAVGHTGGNALWGG